MRGASMYVRMLQVRGCGGLARSRLGTAARAVPRKSYIVSLGCNEGVFLSVTECALSEVGIRVPRVTYPPEGVSPEE